MKSFTKHGFSLVEMAFMLIIMGIAVMIIQKVMYPEMKRTFVMRDKSNLENTADQFISQLKYEGIPFFLGDKNAFTPVRSAAIPPATTGALYKDLNGNGYTVYSGYSTTDFICSQAQENVDTVRVTDRNKPPFDASLIIFMTKDLPNITINGNQLTITEAGNAVNMAQIKAYTYNEIRGVLECPRISTQITPDIFPVANVTSANAAATIITVTTSTGIPLTWCLEADNELMLSAVIRRSGNTTNVYPVPLNVKNRCRGNVDNTNLIRQAEEIELVILPNSTDTTTPPQVISSTYKVTLYAGDNTAVVNENTSKINKIVDRNEYGISVW